MPDDVSRNNIITLSRPNPDSAFEYRQRQHEDWKTNYMLLRDKVITNRLTQRQSVNVPLMKANLSTFQANIAPSPTSTSRA